MKKINFLILFLFSTMFLIGKSFSSTESDEFIKLKETHNINEVRRSIAQLKNLNNEVNEDIKDD